MLRANCFTFRAHRDPFARDALRRFMAKPPTPASAPSRQPARPKLEAAKKKLDAMRAVLRKAGRNV